MKQLFFTLSILYSCILTAQDITLNVQGPAVVAAGEQFRITWVANTRGGNFEAPDFGDFYKLSGPQTSFNQSTQIINGKVHSEISNSFTFFLQAGNEGKFTIPAAKYIYKKKEYLSEPFAIEVVKENQNTTRATGQQGNQPAQQQNNVSSNDLFVRLLVSDRDVYAGEHILASLKLYSRVELSGIQEIKYPDFNSFLKEDLETPPLRTLERENVNGQIYGTGILQRFLLYPQKAGKIVIDPAQLTVLLQQQTKSNDPFFGDFFSSFTTVPKMIASRAVEINVKPLPEGAGAGFEGIVGDISISSDLNADTIEVNEAISYRLSIKGKGNLMLAIAPDIEMSPDIEVYEPKTTSDLNTTSTGTNGTKVFEYIMIPRHHGTFTIPSIKYRYFDPVSASYKNISTKERAFVAVKGETIEESTQIYGGVSKENIKFIGKDIRYINTAKKSLKKAGRVILDNSSFLYVYLIALFAFLFIVFIRREQVKRNSDLARVRNRKAGRVAAKRLRKAAEYIESASTEEFYEELLKALWGYLSDKFNIPVSELSILKVNEILKNYSLGEDLISDLEEAINICEYSRYSPDYDKTVVDKTFTIAERVIKAIENLK